MGDEIEKMDELKEESEVSEDIEVKNSELPEDAEADGDSEASEDDETEESGEELPESKPANDSPKKTDISGDSNVGKPQKGLTGIVIALAFVIVCLVVVLIIVIINKNNESDKKSDTAQTQTSTDITVTPETEKSAEGDTKEDGDSGTTEPEVTTIPEFNVTTVLGKYKGVEVDYQLPPVTEEDVDGAVEYFKNSLTEEVEIEGRALKESDIAVIDFEGTINGEAFEGGSGTDYELALGSHTFIDGFEDGLIGKNIGDVVSLDLTFPENYSEELGGKAVNFKVTIKSGLEEVTPELTDEVVAENSTCKTVQEYRNMARQELEEQAKEYADSQMKNDIMNKVIEGATFTGQIQEQIAYEEEDAIEYYDAMCSANFGIDGATYFGYIWGITQDEYYAMVHEEAETSVKYNYILDEVAKAEGFTVSEEEYKAKFEETFYNYYGFASEEDVYAEISKEEARKIIEGYVLHDKAEAVIMDNAIVNNKPEE